MMLSVLLSLSEKNKLGFKHMLIILNNVVSHARDKLCDSCKHEIAQRSEEDE